MSFVPHSWHALALDQLPAELLGDPSQGLPQQLREERQQRYGLNRLPSKGGRSKLRILVDQFVNVMLLLLIAVAVVSAVLDLRAEQFPKDAVAIGVIVLLNALLGYFQESRAESALAALQALAMPMVKVRIAAEIHSMPAEQLVPGDVVMLEAGDRVPADLRLLEAARLSVQEAALTGESLAVQKDAKAVLSADTGLAERLNCLYQGTEVVNGRGLALVVATGAATELGRIASLLQHSEQGPTPLQERLDQLAKVLVGSALALVALVVAFGALAGQPLAELLEISLSMAVAIVPEGLPAVITVCLAVGTVRMAKRHALIRRLPAVETLGSVTTICSDKTGTLTANVMTVQLIEPADGSAIGKGQWHPLLRCAVLCNDGVVPERPGDAAAQGDPTETALLSAALAQALSPRQERLRWLRPLELPFSSERQRMAVVVSALNQQENPGQSPLLLMKGSPERVLEHCQFISTAAGPRPLNAEDRRALAEHFQSLASEGLRLLGFAERAWQQLDQVSDQTLEEVDEQGLCWLGLIGSIDPPRPEAIAAIGRCRSAGIRTLMITGDHPRTALAIAKQVGLIDHNTDTGLNSNKVQSDLVVSGRELEQLSEQQLEAVVGRSNVFARVLPEQKLDLVKALQRSHQVVAMTGDGVNDAPALRQSDIGVAMGITGTDVSREAADMVLLDDNFATIVSAVEEGRLVYENVRRFIRYILGSNVGELITIAAAPLLGLPVPLSPMQILWMNLVTDGLPALALAVEQSDDNLMVRKPAGRNETIFARGLGRYILEVGLVFAAIAIVLMALVARHPLSSGELNLDPNRWKTIVFTTLCIAQMGHALSARSERPLLQVPLFSNPWLIISVTVTSLLQLALIYVPLLRGFFGTYQLSLAELGLCFAFSLLLLLYLELRKLFKRSHH